MKYLLVNLSANLVSLCCIGAAGYLAANSKTGWGWFLFVGLLSAARVSFPKKD